MSAAAHRLCPVHISGSVAAAGPLHVGAAAAAAEAAGVDWLHIDIMDGHFVASIEGSVRLVAALKSSCRLPLDVHLMVMQPQRWVGAYADAGADAITVHLEAQHDVAATLAQCRHLGVQVGLSLCPNTELQQLQPHLEAVDWVQVMSVQPGRSGQKLLPEQLRKVERLAHWQRGYGLNFGIAIDGGIEAGNIRQAVTAGAQRLVAGSALWPPQTTPRSSVEAGEHLQQALASLRAAAAGDAATLRPPGRHQPTA